MSQLSEILEIEKKRDTAESQCVVNLFQEGTFYRAYEWSAWLCVRYINGFKVTKRDLFGWGTSGWNNGNYMLSLTDGYGNADWGVYNTIYYNGEATSADWRSRKLRLHRRAVGRMTMKL